MNTHGSVQDQERATHSLTASLREGSHDQEEQVMFLKDMTLAVEATPDCHDDLTLLLVVPFDSTLGER